MATTLLEACQIVNQSLRNIGYDYQIDTTSNETMTDGLNQVGAFPSTQLNQIMEQMNLVIQFRNFGTMFNAEKNPFREFLTNLSETGFGIEDLYQEIIGGVTPFWDEMYTDAQRAENLVGYEPNNIHKKFHTTPFSKQFKTTVDARNYNKVFTPYGVTRYIDVRIANLSWSAEVYLQNTAIELIKTMVNDNAITIFNGNNVNTDEGIKKVVEDIRSITSDMLKPSDRYNVDGVLSITNSKDDLFIVTTSEYIERLRVHGYANAFNLSEFEVKGRIIYAPNGSDFGEVGGEKVQFVILDRRAIVLGIRYWLASSRFVENSHWVNHWLTVEGIQGYNTFINAVALTGVEITDFIGEHDEAYLVINVEAAYSSAVPSVTNAKLLNKTATYDGNIVYTYAAKKGDTVSAFFETFFTLSINTSAGNYEYSGNGGAYTAQIVMTDNVIVATLTN